MRYRLLGRSGLLVSELCLGTMIFGEESPRGTDAQTAERLLHMFLDAGGNLVDTADVYAEGRSEEIVGAAIRDRRDQVVLATKIRFSTGARPTEQGLSRQHLISGVDASLRRLKTDFIDLLYVHSWDNLTPLEETLRALDDLVTGGKIRYIGVSNFKGWQFMKALATSEFQGWNRFVAAQYQYSLVDRNIEHEIADLCVHEEVGLVPWGPLGGGFLTGKYSQGGKPEEGRLSMMPDDTEEAWVRRNVPQNWEVLEAVVGLAKSHHCAPSQVALAWLLKQPGVSSIVLGARTPGQLQDNIAAGQLKLQNDEMSELNRISVPNKPYPYGYLEVYGDRDPSPEYSV